MKLIASGYAEYPGWITAKPKTRITIPKDKTKYSIAVYQSSKEIGLSGKKQTGYKNSGTAYNTTSPDSFGKGKSYKNA